MNLGHFPKSSMNPSCLFLRPEVPSLSLALGLLVNVKAVKEAAFT